jgi:hypothetical protein
MIGGTGIHNIGRDSVGYTELSHMNVLDMLDLSVGMDLNRIGIYTPVE